MSRPELIVEEKTFVSRHYFTTLLFYYFKYIIDFKL